MSTTTTPIKTKKQFVPALRFNEFDGDWKEKRFGEVLKLVTRPIKMNDDDSYSLVTIKRRYEGIVHRGYYLGKEVKVKSQFLLEENDFVISKRQISHNSCGLVPAELKGAIVSNEYSVFLPKDVLDILYFDYFCRQPKISNTFFLSSIGVHIEKMIFKVDDWLKWKFHYPNIPEQQKIASFLSAVDEKIQQLTKKKTLLEQYKKGVMQQLFSGQLRFKDENGNPYPDWEEKRLGDVGKIKMCKRIFSHQTTEIGDIPFYKIGTFGKEADAYIPINLFLEFKEKYSYPQVGEILMSASGTLGRTVIYDGSDAYFQDSNIVWIQNNEQLITNDFLFYVYQVVRYQSEGGTIQRLYNSIINSAKFLKPSLFEQEKVTKLLSSIDTKIESVNNQITQTQTFKKGLLQQMFVAA